MILVWLLVLNKRPFMSLRWLETQFLPNMFPNMKIFLIFVSSVNKTQKTVKKKWWRNNSLWDHYLPSPDFFFCWIHQSGPQLWIHPRLRVNTLAWNSLKLTVMDYQFVFCDDIFVAHSRYPSEKEYLCTCIMMYFFYMC